MRAILLPQIVNNIQCEFLDALSPGKLRGQYGDTNQKERDTPGAGQPANQSGSDND